jgi:hypothetical protein
LSFPPQRNIELFEAERAKGQTIRNEAGMGIIDAHKTKASTANAGIGSILDMRDVTSLCINLMSVLHAFTSDTGPELILYQYLAKNVDLTINRVWDEWKEACGSEMPHIHLHIISFIKKIWSHVAGGEMDFNNTNVVTESRRIGELNLTHVTKAAQVMKGVVDQVTLAQSPGVLITVMASIVSKYRLRSPPLVGTKSSNTATPNPPVAPPNHCNGKHNTSSPDGQQPMKARKINNPKFHKKDMGMSISGTPTRIC